MNKYICTFGSGHLGGLGLYYHIEVHAPDSLIARRIMAHAFDGKWSSIYEEEFNYPAKYHTIRLGMILFNSYNPEFDEVPYYKSLYSI